MINKVRVALMGNPNCGKSSIFNSLTGSRQHVGNWPGKTVEVSRADCIYGNGEVELIDLPGTYSLAAYSLEEVIARDFLLDEKPDVVVCVVDAANLERNLYLTVQVLELGFPIVLALNMVDVTEAAGVRIDEEKIGRALQCPVIRTIARDGKGVKELIEAAVCAARSNAE